MNRFSFLEQDYPELYQRCSEAMEYGLQDFSIAMLKSRQALEKIVEHFDAEGENLFTKINALGDSGEIPKSVMKHFHTVRQVANPSVHGQEVSEAEILDALDALFEITVWLAVRKEEHRYEAELFNDRDYFIVRRYETQTGKEDSTVSGGTPSGRTQEIDFEKILEQYKQAAEAGDSDAMFNVGEMYAIGKGIVQDYDEAMQWYQKAADEGNTAAMIAMGKLYAEGKGAQQNFGKAMEWYQKAADADNQDAAALLGECYEKGEGIAQDYAESMRRYQAAAEKGSTVAMRNLSRFFAEGNGIAKDEKTALKWLQRAANQGDTESMKILAYKHLHGEWGLLKNPDVAVNWLRRASNAGNMEAMINLGDCFADGLYDVPQNRDEAAKWFENAAQAGSAVGMSRLGDFYLRLDRYDRYKKIILFMDHSKLTVKDFFECNPMIGIKWYRKAASLGDANALGHLGILYILGIAVSRDIGEGLKCLHKSAEAGNYDARKFLGWMYSKGYGVTRNIITAKEWYQKAAEVGHQKAPPKNDSCFITTAVCGSLQKPDDCYELTSFRTFRDGWLSAQPDGAALIDEYYAVAPPIVRAIDALPDAKEIYRGIWDKYLAPCLVMLEAKNMRGCKETYVKMVRDLQARFG